MLPSVTQSEIFYEDLDTVRFAPEVPAPERRAQTVAAIGSMMLGLLVGNTAALLSQTQAFDSQPLLGLLAGQSTDAGSKDRLAFLRLARSGWIRVGVVPAKRLRDDPPDGRRRTLLNAFRTALGNPGFRLSAWPELADQDLRARLLEGLDRAPDDLDTEVGPALAARAEGLLELDRSLRRGQRNGKRSIIRVGTPAGDALDARVHADLQSAGDGSELAAVRRWLSGPTAWDTVNSRSAWYSVADTCPVPDGPAALRQLVDGHYNAIVGESLGAPGLSLTCADDDAALLLARHYGLKAQLGSRMVDLLPTPGLDWLRWSHIPGLLDELQDVSPSRRLTDLHSRQLDWLKGQPAPDPGLGLSLQLALPASMLTTAASMGESVVGGSPPAHAAAQAAVTGIVALLAATPLARRAGRRLRSRAERRQAGQRHRGEQWENAIRTGAAAWPDLTQPHTG